MVKNEHENFFAESFYFHWEHRLPSLNYDIFYHIVTNVFGGYDFGEEDKIWILDGILVWRELYSNLLA